MLGPLNQSTLGWLAIGVIASTLMAGCSRKADAKTELEKAASVLAQEDKGPAAPAPSPAQPAPTAQAPTVTEPVAPPPIPASQQMQEAMASYKTGQLEDAVTRLQKLRRTPTLTAEQRIAVQNSVAAVMNEIYEMASKGDARAIAAVRQYEEMQTAPRQ
jgi:hypothetical protein